MPEPEGVAVSREHAHAALLRALDQARLLETRFYAAKLRLRHLGAPSDTLLVLEDLETSLREVLEPLKSAIQGLRDALQPPQSLSD